MTDSSLLDDPLDLDNQLCFALYSASRRVIRAYNEALETLDLTYTQYLVLLVLWEWDRTDNLRPTVKAMGKRLNLESGTLTPLLRRVERKGLLVRERSTEDEREVYLRLTARGKALKRRAQHVPQAMVARCSLTIDELCDLREQLKRLRDGAAA